MEPGLLCNRRRKLKRAPPLSAARFPRGESVRNTTSDFDLKYRVQLQRKLRWDPEQEKLAGDPQANAMLSRQQREPWTIDNVDSWINVG